VRAAARARGGALGRENGDRDVPVGEFTSTGIPSFDEAAR
jgi:hypothetical protein